MLKWWWTTVFRGETSLRRTHEVCFSCKFCTTKIRGWLPLRPRRGIIIRMESRKCNINRYFAPGFDSSCMDRIPIFETFDVKGIIILLIESLNFDQTSASTRRSVTSRVFLNGTSSLERDSSFVLSRRETSSSPDNWIFFFFFFVLLSSKITSCRLNIGSLLRRQSHWLK